MEPAFLFENMLDQLGSGPQCLDFPRDLQEPLALLPFADHVERVADNLADQAGQPPEHELEDLAGV